MENIPNGELSQYIRFKKKLPLEEVKYLAAQIVLILELLRGKGVVHRDLKPENLILSQKNTLKVIDFGTADVLLREDKSNQDLYNKYRKIREKYAEQDNFVQDIAKKSKRKSFVGTVFYIAPEMLKT